MLWHQISSQITVACLSRGCAVTSTFSNLACSSLVLNISLLSADLISPMHPSENNNVLKWQERAREFPSGCLTVWLNSTCPKVNSYFPMVQLPLPTSCIDKSFKSFRLTILEISITFTKSWGFILSRVFCSQIFLYVSTTCCHYAPLTSHLHSYYSFLLVPTLPGATLPAVILYTVAQCIFFRCDFDYVIPHLPLSFLG